MSEWNESDPRERSAPARREEMAAFAAKLKADPAKAQAFFQEAGILNDRGELMPQYGGTAHQDEPVATVNFPRCGGDLYTITVPAELPQGSYPLYLHPSAELARLRAENERLKADAARYQWLRDDAAYVNQMQFASVIPNDQWDARIDAAMAQGKV